MDIEQPITVETEIEVAPVESVPSPVAEEAYDEEDSMEADEYDPEDWLHLSPDRLARSEAQVNAIRETFKDEVDEWDTTMVSEYADEIFAYMESMEVRQYSHLFDTITQHVNRPNACQTPTTSLAKQKSNGRCAPLWLTG
jgi:dGTP triphosphohydrolase